MGLNFKYTIRNIGTIDSATIMIKPLTIIAGENSSGKTFVTKSLYTILNSIYKNYFSENLIKEYQLLDESCRSFIDVLDKPTTIDTKFDIEYSNYSIKIKLIIQELVNCSFPEQENLIAFHQNTFTGYKSLINTYFDSRKNLKKFSNFIYLITEIQESIDKLLNILNNRREMLVDSINSSLETGFKKNFQITNLKHLIKKNQDKSLYLEIENIGNIEIDSKSNINFNFTSSGIQTVQDVKNIVFFDSPVYIKIRKALEKEKIFKMFHKDEDKYLKGYPEYLEQLYNFIDKEYIDTADFNDVSLEIQNIISGKLNITKGGEIQYTDSKGSSIPLSLTAMGITNIGLIDLLLRNNVINKGSFLIMDEPEVHLHPKWQVELANILYKIAQSGATIIIATHSLDLLKAFQTLLKNTPMSEDIIAINKMPYLNDFSELSENKKINTVLDDLSEPYCNLFM